MKTREQFKSGLGFVLVSAGCAIGIGNVWKFPYVAGANGGGVFVLFYLLFLAIMGIPTLTMEFAVGRASKLGAVGAYKALEKPGHKWHYHGWVCIAGCYILMMYYTSVSGWMLDYFVKFATGAFEGVTTEAVSGIYEAMLGNPSEMIFYTMITIMAAAVICSFSLQGGLERISKFMMLGLLLLIGVLAANSFVLEGAAEGLSFFLLPDWGKAMEVGIFNVIVAAMNQAFFTLSVGMASMEIFGSYMSRDNTLTTEAIRICSLDTFVAISAGLIIFPACFSYGIEPDAGPPLIFETLPAVFVNMPFGRVVGSLFFLFMTFASFSTVLGVLQNIIAFGEENLGLKKIPCVIINAAALIVLSLPAIFGYNILSFISLDGKNILDMEDFLVSNLILPIGALIYLLFCVHRSGWGFDNYLNECNTGRGIKLSPKLKPYFRFVLPLLILSIIIAGLIP